MRTMSAGGYAVKVALDPANVVKLTPKATIYVGWLDHVELFTKGVEVEITPELHAFLLASGHGHLI
jgi:hypothetical protein